MVDTGEPAPYLIAHKVRGEVAYDIATRLGKIEDNMWIIPTSGHRAYPYWWRRLDTLELSKYATKETILNLAERIPMPSDWPDHYSVNAAPRRSLGEILGGFLRPRESTLQKRKI